MEYPKTRVTVYDIQNVEYVRHMVRGVKRSGSGAQKSVCCLDPKSPTLKYGVFVWVGVKSVLHKKLLLACE